MESVKYNPHYDEVEIIISKEQPFLIKEYDSILTNIYDHLESVGCLLKNEASSILNKYENQKVKSIAHFDPLSKTCDPLEIFMCPGLDCLVSDHPKYVELKDLRDVVELPPTRLIA